MKNLKVTSLLKIVLVCGIFFSSASFGVSEIVEGRHYKKLSPTLRNTPIAAEFRAQDRGKVQILIFFSYGCYWCGKINKPIDEWAKKQSDKVAIHFLPVCFNNVFERLAKAFYATEALDTTGKIDDDIFDGIHEQRINYARIDLLTKLFESHGITKEIFQQTFNSFAIGLKVTKAKELTKAYKISATPNIIVNGKTGSYITNLAVCGEVDVLIKTLDYLINK